LIRSAVANFSMSHEQAIFRGQIPMDSKVEQSNLGAQLPRSRRRKRHSKVFWIVLLLILIALAAGGWYAWQTWNDAKSTTERVPTATVQRGDLEDAITATGTLQPRDFVDVGTQVSGQLKVLHVQIGSTVKQGDLLAEIDPTVFQSRVDSDQAQLRNQQAQLRDKQSQLALAEQVLARQKGLMSENATTQEALQSAEASVRSLNAQLEAIRAQIQQTESSLRGNEANLGYTKIYAPMAGTVASLPAKQGQTLNANQQAPTILRVADLSVMTVQAQVSEADVPKLRVGMEVYFTTLGGDGKRWYGTLRQINPTPVIQNNVVLYDALFDVPNSSGDLMTQMTAQVFFLAAQAKDAIYVPITALRPVAGRRGAGKAVEKAGDAKADEGKAVEGKAQEGQRNSEARETTGRAQSEAESKAGPQANETRKGGRGPRGEEGRGGDDAQKGDANRNRGDGRRSESGEQGERRLKGGERSESGERRVKGGDRSAGDGATKAERQAKGVEGKSGGEGRSGERSRGTPAPGFDPRAQFTSGRALVRVQKEDGTFEEREVRVGMMNRVSAQILEGLQPGEVVQMNVGGRGGPGGAGKGGSGKGGAPKFAAKI
jgi:membrane fusion protein, macrolide-specific efflux system